jgi:hypothetical protein
MSWRIAFDKVLETHKKVFPYFRNACMVSGGILGLYVGLDKQMNKYERSDPITIWAQSFVCGNIGIVMGLGVAYTYPVSIPVAVYSIYEDLK